MLFHGILRASLPCKINPIALQIISLFPAFYYLYYYTEQSASFITYFISLLSETKPFRNFNIFMNVFFACLP